MRVSSLELAVTESQPGQGWCRSSRIFSSATESSNDFGQLGCFAICLHVVSSVDPRGHLHCWRPNSGEKEGAGQYHRTAAAVEQEHTATPAKRRDTYAALISVGGRLSR